MTHQHAPDIEIYLRGISADALELWLTEQLDDLTPSKRVAGMPKHSRPFQGVWQDQRFMVLVIEKVADGFTSLWLNHSDLPWRDDLACAQAAAAFFNCEVRIAAGGWQEGSDPDAWLAVQPDGRQAELKWHTEGA